MLSVKRYGKKLVAMGLGHTVSLNQLRNLEQYLDRHNKNSNTITLEELTNVLKENNKGE
jgi:hypothetical protein